MKGLSICIPVFNFNCFKAVKTLCNEIELLQIDAEVIVFDDASPNNLTALKTYNNSNYTYKKLNHNVGRAKIRNLLAEASKFDNLLFLDGDSGILENFILNYILAIKKYPNTVINGGRKHLNNTEKSKKLRYNYGVKFEDKKVNTRNKKPYLSLITNNFVVPKSIIKKIQFNETLITYGHEDTFFAYELKQNKIPIVHIDNPVIHLDLDSSEVFIKKTKDGIKNLILLSSQYPEFATYSKLHNLITKYPVFRFKTSKLFSSVLSNLFEYISRIMSNAYTFQLFKLFYTISRYN